MFSKSILLTTLVGLCFFATMPSIHAQKFDIFELMERRDLKLAEVDKIAQSYFQTVGTGQGTGYKQYNRWYNEQQFHLTPEGYLRDPEDEFQAYLKTASPRSALLNTWTELGPFTKNPTSSWNPGVGRLTWVAIHPSDESTIYVSSPGGGIWKSTDAGASWTPLIDFVNSSWMNVYALCIDPLNVNTIYAGLSSGGVLKSTNAGATWATTGSGPSGIRKIMVHPSNSNIVFACASGGFYRSTNGGGSWTRTETTGKWDMEFKPDDSNTIVASGSTNTIWRSTDNGVTWTSQTVTGSGRTLLAVTAADPNVVYVLQANGSLFGWFYKSTNAGTSYTTQITGGASNNYFGYEASGTGTTGQATYDMAMCANPTNANEVHIAGIICWVSTNGGTSFTATTEWFYPNSTGYNHADVHGLEWINNTIYSVSDGGLYKTTNKGGDWTDMMNGIGIRQLYRLGVSKTTAGMLASGAQDNGTIYRQSGLNWVEWLGADGMEAIISPNDANLAIGTSQNGGIYRTTNAGNSRTSLTKPNSGNWVTPLAWHPTSQDTVYGGFTGVYRSSNKGTSWTDIASGVITSTVTCLAVAPSNAQYIYASIGTTLYRTKNAGATWTTITASGSISSICVSPSNPEKLWITTTASSDNVQVSTNFGTSFTTITAGLPAIAARSVCVDNTTVENLYVGMNIGVYHRNNDNPTWTEQAAGLPLVAVNEVEVQHVSGKLFVATYGRGIWESPLKAGIIPVELTKFEGFVAEKANKLAWQTAAQSHFSHCVLERSADGMKGWETLAQVSVKNNSGGFANYDFEDVTPLDLGYYRLIMVDNDGSSAYSKIISIARQSQKWGSLKLSPNPVKEDALIEFSTNSTQPFSLILTDVSGREVKILRGVKSADLARYKFPMQDLTQGVYYLTITDGVLKTTQKVFKF
jgi:hypothetical protein